MATWGARPSAGQPAAAVAVAALTTAAYWSWLGWDQHKEIGPDGYLHGPYEPWQVEGCVGTLLVVGVVACLAGFGRALIFAMTVSLTICFSISGITDPENDGLWGVGAMMVALGTWAGTRTMDWLLTPIRRALVSRRGS